MSNKHFFENVILIFQLFVFATFCLSFANRIYILALITFWIMMINSLLMGLVDRKYPY